MWEKLAGKVTLGREYKWKYYRALIDVPIVANCVIRIAKSS